MNFRQNDNSGGIANVSYVSGKVGVSKLTKTLLERVFLRAKQFQFATSFGEPAVFSYQDSCS